MLRHGAEILATQEALYLYRSWTVQAERPAAARNLNVGKETDKTDEGEHLVPEQNVNNDMHEPAEPARTENIEAECEQRCGR